MEATAVCLTLVMNVLMPLVAQIQRGCYAQESDAALLHVDPNRLQLFLYEPVSFNCEGLDGSVGWRVMRRIRGKFKACPTNWETSNGSSCSIENTYAADSGEYWCENRKGEISRSVNIAVTVGSVILESPVLPVTEGSDVTLRCRNKTTPSSFRTEFYKNGVFIRSSSTGEMTIHSVSKSDEGFYKCSVSDSGASPESWLDVGAPHKETHPFPWTVVIFVTVALLLVVGLVALLYFGRHKVAVWRSSQTQTLRSEPGQAHQSVSGGAAEANPRKATYATVTKHRQNREHGAFTFSERMTNPLSVNDDDFYSVIH